MKSILEQATKAQGWGDVYLYSFFKLGARLGWVANATPRPLYPRERPGTHCIGGWNGHRNSLDGRGKKSYIGLRVNYPLCLSVWIRLHLGIITIPNSIHCLLVSSLLSKQRQEQVICTGNLTFTRYFTAHLTRQLSRL